MELGAAGRIDPDRFTMNPFLGMPTCSKIGELTSCMKNELHIFHTEPRSSSSHMPM
jgi:hypothetical protein